MDMNRKHNFTYIFAIATLTLASALASAPAWASESARPDFPTDSAIAHDTMADDTIAIDTIEVEEVIPAFNLYSNSSTVNADSIASEEIPFSAADAFTAIPRQYLDILTISMRRDMVDYMMADSIRKQPNVFRDFSWIEEMNPTYMRVHLTDASSLQIKILPGKEINKNGSAKKDGKKGFEPLVMTIYTVEADGGVADSTIKFFTKEMQELPLEKYFELPDPKSFYEFPKGKVNGKKVDRQAIYDLIPFYTIKYNISRNPNSNELKGELTIIDYLTLEQAKEVKPYLRPNKTWQWQKEKFQLQK